MDIDSFVVTRPITSAGSSRSVIGRLARLFALYSSLSLGIAVITLLIRAFLPAVETFRLLIALGLIIGATILVIRVQALKRGLRGYLRKPIMTGEPEEFSAASAHKELKFEHPKSTKIETPEAAHPGTGEKKWESASQTAFEVFLCHASADKTAVRELYKRLRQDGIYPWLDEEELLPGQDWRSEIERVLRETPAVVVCISRSSITKSGYVEREMRLALDLLEEQPEGTTFVIPVRLEECLVPDRLKHLRFCDLYLGDGYQYLLNSLRFRTRRLASAAGSIKAPNPEPQADG